MDVVVNRVGEPASFGPFFAVELHAPSQSPVGAWRPMIELLTDGVSLPARIEQVRAALSGSGTGGGTAERSLAVEGRVAASVAHLGLVARLVAPAMVAALLPVRFEVDLETAWWQPEVGGPYPLSLASSGSAWSGSPWSGSAWSGSASSGPDAGREPGAAVRGLLHGGVAQLTEAVGRCAGVSARVLWGNVASAVNSAAVQIGTGHPEYADAAVRVAGSVLSQAPLDAQPARVGPHFRRRSCCLIYRVGPERGVDRRAARNLCGDCVLRTDRPVRS